jgi:hypothetical protein
MLYTGWNILEDNIQYQKVNGEDGDTSKLTVES